MRDLTSLVFLVFVVLRDRFWCGGKITKKPSSA